MIRTQTNLGETLIITQTGKTCQIKVGNHTIEIPHSFDRMEMGVDHWDNGVLIQNAFPFLSVDHRELFLSGSFGLSFEWDEE